MSDLESIHVLVVDDNAHMRAIIVAILRGIGISRIKEAADGADALEAMRTVTPDLVFLDLNMAQIDGLEFTKMIRTAEDSPSPYVPIIMVTGHSDISKIIAARDVGVNEILTKPISAHSLLERINAVINNPRPFVTTPNYTGPCRRRANRKTYNGPLRRKTD